jgi:hypothetical protein
MSTFYLLPQVTKSYKYLVIILTCKGHLSQYLLVLRLELSEQT